MSAATELVYKAVRERQLLELAGETDNPEIRDPLDQVREDLEKALELARTIRGHAHVFAVDEDDRSLCVVCGADGDA